MHIPLIACSGLTGVIMTMQGAPNPAAQVGDVTVQIARWFDDKAAAVSLRFDDSHRSHLDVAIPLLDRYGMVGTFLINPGRESYQQRRQEWETAVLEGGHELGNHTVHHRGAQSDEEADREIGACSRYIWDLFPGKSKLLAFRSGGGTTWKIEKPWSHYHEKWHLIQARKSASVGSVPEKVSLSDLDAFTRRLDQTIADADCMSFYFHGIGSEQGMGISERLFRDMMSALYRKRREVWFGGIAQIHKYEKERQAATVAAEMVGEQKLKLEVDCAIPDPELYDQPLTLKVELTRDWPGDDVQALDVDERPIPIRRTTEKWHRLLIPVPPVRGTYYVHVVDPTAGKPEPVLPAESERTARDAATGLTATICKWLDGRRAAHSIRFDDSHPTHILHVIPLLREYGYRGTFMINPGRPNYQNHKDAWEACARQGDQELANHTHHHSGCTDDDDADRELGDTARYIWSLFPNRSKLLILARGGATTWTTTTPFRYWLDKYHLVSLRRGSVSMADEYGPRLPLFQRRLAEALENGSWFQTHYHAIGEGHLSMTEENFAAVLEITKQHEDRLWISGMADIYKYRQERSAASLALTSAGPKRATLRVSCATDPELYDQRLTIQLSLPETWAAEAVTVTDGDAEAVATRTATVDGTMVLRFEAPPVEATYSIAVH
jgi:peptidoglycan/xylan/chitin deacetylase (PgdA/CDA1 family)